MTDYGFEYLEYSVEILKRIQKTQYDKIKKRLQIRWQK